MSGSGISRILERCKWTTELYIPAIWDPPANREAVSIDSCTQLELLVAGNSASVGIEWVDQPDDIVKKYQGLLVIFTHGFTEHIAPRMVNAARSVALTHKLGVCVVKMQGSAGVGLSTNHTALGFSFLSEIQAVSDRISQHVGVTFPKIALGFGLGGVPLIEYSGSAFSGMVLVSCPLNVDRFCSSEANGPTLLCGKKLVKDNGDFLTRHFPIEMTKAMEAASLEEFVALAKPIGIGFPLTDLYQFLDNKTQPTLLFYALDDVHIEFSQTVDLVRLCRNPNIAVAVVESGGHCEFFSVTKTNWLIHAICEFASRLSLV